MKPFLTLACALFAANSLFADPYSAAIQQAKRVANQETEANRQLMNNPPPATPAQTNPNQPSDPVLQATLENIQNLQNDFATLSKLTNAAAITTEKVGLTNDLASAALGAKPSQPSLAKLGDDLAAVILGNQKLRPQHPRLAQYVHASFNGSKLTPAQQQMIFSDVQKILVAGGTAPEDATNVVNDIKTIASETK
jgi:hypothetical protein